MSKQRAKGTAAETAVVNYLRCVGFEHADRAPLRGKNDQGDITGIGQVCVEVKNHQTINLADFLDQARREGKGWAAYSVAWIKRRGKASPADWYVVMDGATFCDMLRQVER